MADLDAMREDAWKMLLLKRKLEGKDYGWNPQRVFDEGFDLAIRAIIDDPKLYSHLMVQHMLAGGI